MRAEFDECLKKQKIKRFSRGKSLVRKEMEAAASDLSQARETLKHGSCKWAMIQSYYAMFHAARALLYAKNYRERSHYCLIVAIDHFYVDAKLMPTHLLEALKRGKMLRENADYYDQWSETGARQMLNDADEFVCQAQKLLAAAE